MINDTFSVKGNLHITHIVAGGYTQEYDFKNLVVTTGKELIASRLVNTADGVMTHMGVGSGSTAVVAGNTQLETQISSRVALDSTARTGSSITYVTTFGPGVCTGAITEAGIFNASTSGTMLSRTVFGVINKAAGDTVIINWNISIV